MRSVVGFLSQRGLHGDPLLTQDFQRRRLRGCRNLYKKDLLGHFGCVNAIEFSNNGGQWLVSGKSTPFPAPRLPAPFQPPLSLSLATLLLPSAPPSSTPLLRWEGLVSNSNPYRGREGKERMSSVKKDLKWLTGP